MPKTFKRSTIFHVNKFQKNLFYPVITAFFIGCVVSWLSIIYFIVGDFLANPGLDWLWKLIPVLLSVAAAFMIVVIFWMFRLSSRYFGSYERVIRELDDVLAGDPTDTLKTREGDVIFSELIKRINMLIKRKR